jgi:hypothetical protein
MTAPDGYAPRRVVVANVLIPRTDAGDSPHGRPQADIMGRIDEPSPRRIVVNRTVI